MQIDNWYDCNFFIRKFVRYRLQMIWKFDISVAGLMTKKKLFLFQKSSKVFLQKLSGYSANSWNIRQKVRWMDCFLEKSRWLVQKYGKMTSIKRVKNFSSQGWCLPFPKWPRSENLAFLCTRILEVPLTQNTDISRKVRKSTRINSGSGVYLNPNKKIFLMIRANGEDPSAFADWIDDEKKIERFDINAIITPQPDRGDRWFRKIRSRNYKREKKTSGNRRFYDFPLLVQFFTVILWF